VMDREFDVGFVKDEPAFQELRSVLVYSDEMILIASPRHPLAQRPTVLVKDLGSESFMMHHLCVATEQKILRLFESHSTHCNIAAELWSFESIKHFVQQDVGLAFVPKISVLNELAQGSLVDVPLEGLNMPRRIFMVYRNRGYVSDSAQQFIDVMGQFNWDECLPKPEPRQPARRAVLRAVRQRRGAASL
jgi:DNA-binding transcriptional LysR family regulator